MIWYSWHVLWKFQDVVNTLLRSAQYISHKDIGSISGAISWPREPHNVQGFHVETYAEYMYNTYWIPLGYFSKCLLTSRSVFYTLTPISSNEYFQDQGVEVGVEAMEWYKLIIVIRSYLVSFIYWTTLYQVMQVCYLVPLFDLHIKTEIFIMFFR